MRGRSYWAFFSDAGVDVSLVVVRGFAIAEYSFARVDMRRVVHDIFSFRVLPTKQTCEAGRNWFIFSKYL